MSTFEDGTDAYEEEDFDRAFEIMLPLAEAGDRDAQTVIGIIWGEAQKARVYYDK